MNRRDRRANGHRGSIVEREPVALIVDHARLLGCTCIPDVHFHTGPMKYGELGSISLAHDADCELITNGNQTSALVVMPPDTEER